MRVAITSSEQLFLDSLVGLFSDFGFAVVVSGTDARDCIIAARLAKANLFVFDLRGASERDVLFLLGAQQFGNLKSIFITDGNADFLSGEEITVSRDDSSQVLLNKARELVADHLLPNVRGSGRPRRTLGGFELSDREYELASLIAQGFGNQKIGELMGLKENSVKNLATRVVRKLGCENRVQVALHLSIR